MILGGDAPNKANSIKQYNRTVAMELYEDGFSTAYNLRYITINRTVPHIFP